MNHKVNALTTIPRGLVAVVLALATGSCCRCERDDDYMYRLTVRVRGSAQDSSCLVTVRINDTSYDDPLPYVTLDGTGAFDPIFYGDLQEAALMALRQD